MSNDEDGSAGPASQSNSERDSSGNPFGPQIVLESNVKLNSLSPGDRIYMVALRDPTIRRDIAGAIVLNDQTVKAVERIAFAADKPFERVLSSVAFRLVAKQIWGGMPPTDAEVIGVAEISRSELIRFIQLEEVDRAQSATQAS